MPAGERRLDERAPEELRPAEHEDLTGTSGRAPDCFGAELERICGNALVGRVDVLQPDEVVRHPHRQEAVALDPDGRRSVHR